MHEQFGIQSSQWITNKCCPGSIQELKRTGEHLILMDSIHNNTEPCTVKTLLRDGWTRDSHVSLFTGRVEGGSSASDRRTGDRFREAWHNVPLVLEGIRWDCRIQNALTHDPIGRSSWRWTSLRGSVRSSVQDTPSTESSHGKKRATVVLVNLTVNLTPRRQWLVAFLGMGVLGRQVQQIRRLLDFFCFCKPLNQIEGVLTRQLTIVFPFQAGKISRWHWLLWFGEDPKKQVPGKAVKIKTFIERNS